MVQVWNGAHAGIVFVLPAALAASWYGIFKDPPHNHWALACDTNGMVMRSMISSAAVQQILQSGAQPLWQI